MDIKREWAYNDRYLMIINKVNKIKLLTNLSQK